MRCMAGLVTDGVGPNGSCAAMRCESVVGKERGIDMIQEADGFRITMYR